MKRTLALLLLLAPIALAAQTEGGLDPASLTKPLGDSWPTYSGDYTGRRCRSPSQERAAVTSTAAAPPRFAGRFSWSMAFSTPPHPTTRGPLTRAMAPFCGTSTGRHAAEPTRDIAASA